ncbi:MAG: MarR family transcriptional regulator [Ignavibacteriaceae bacterium]|nr:MarR family transcriptional regulator [Ignavibacteriaceae bacterium]
MKVRAGYHTEQIRDLSWESIREKLGVLQTEVMNCIEAEGTCSTEEIADKLKRRISSVTGRVNELRALGMIELSHTKQSPVTGRNVSHWRVKYPVQGSLF